MFASFFVASFPSPHLFKSPFYQLVCKPGWGRHGAGMRVPAPMVVTGVTGLMTVALLAVLVLAVTVGPIYSSLVFSFKLNEKVRPFERITAFVGPGRALMSKEVQGGSSFIRSGVLESFLNLFGDVTRVLFSYVFVCGTPGNEPSNEPQPTKDRQQKAKRGEPHKASLVVGSGVRSLWKTMVAKQ